MLTKILLNRGEMEYLDKFNKSLSKERMFITKGCNKLLIVVY